MWQKVEWIVTTFISLLIKEQVDMRSLYLVIILILSFSFVSQSQSKYNKKSRQLHKAKYRAQIISPSKKCSILESKRRSGPELITKRKRVKKPKVIKSAEIDYPLSARLSSNPSLVPTSASRSREVTPSHRLQAQ